MINKRSNS